MINPNDPALPSTTKELHETELNMGEYYVYKSYPGLSIREELAARAMIGILGRSTIQIVSDYGNVASLSVKYADALIKELSRK